MQAEVLGLRLNTECFLKAKVSTKARGTLTQKAKKMAKPEVLTKGSQMASKHPNKK
jgi:hypothetical protein